MHVFNIDWLQLFCHINAPMPKGILGIYKFEQQKYSTKQFRTVNIAYIRDREFATILTTPVSDVLNPKSCMIKFNNSVLYESNLHLRASEFIKLLNCLFVSISRLDICCDFQHFNNTLNPSDFIKGFLSNKFAKKANCQFKLNGYHGKQNTYHAITFGSQSSPVTYKLYNKYKELNEHVMKPYIVDCAKLAGINTDIDFWRLEFTLNSTNKKLCTTDGVVIYDSSDMAYCCQNIAKAIFISCFSHYFSFVYKDDQKRKDRMKPIDLLTFDKVSTCVFTPISSTNSSAADKIFINKLAMLNDELRGKDFDLSIFSKQLLTDFTYNRGLERYALKKGHDLYYSDAEGQRDINYVFKKHRYIK